MTPSSMLVLPTCKILVKMKGVEREVGAVNQQEGKILNSDPTEGGRAPVYFLCKFCDCSDVSHFTPTLHHSFCKM